LPSLSPWSPVAIVATWFGTGLLPRMPGTWGALAALPVAVAITGLGDAWGAWALLAAAAALFGVGVWAGGIYAARTSQSDPGAVVVDEVVGQWLAAIPVATLSPGVTMPTHLAGWVMAFVFFRFFDIVKVWPANACERHFKGGFGIMADDVVAGVYAAAATAAGLGAMGG